MKEETGGSKKPAVRDFLQEVKQTVARHGVKEQGWVLVKRKENMDCLAELELDFRDVRDAILGLLVTDYCEGPVPDRDMPGDLWIFGKVIGSREVYIKLKLAAFGSLSLVRVISFHIARESLCYPYKQK